MAAGGVRRHQDGRMSRRVSPPVQREPLGVGGVIGKAANEASRAFTGLCGPRSSSCRWTGFGRLT